MFNLRLFVPMMAGANLKDRLIACLGVLIAICLTGILSGWMVQGSFGVPLLVAMTGASAVLIFLIPASPLAQPWPVLGGNVLSTLVGMLVFQLTNDVMIGAGIAVALAILLMSILRCLHPPGGAAALVAVVAGPGLLEIGYFAAALPVIVNSVLIILLGVLFHRVLGRNYPHDAKAAVKNEHKTDDKPAPLRVGFNETDIEEALKLSGQTYDIAPEDIGRILRQVEQQSLLRNRGTVICSDIMSRDVKVVSVDATKQEARELLLYHNIRTLPVINSEGKLAGIVGLRELHSDAGIIADVMRQPAVAQSDQPVVSLIPFLTDGLNHAVVIIDKDKNIQGLITQTDLLVALARSLRYQPEDPSEPKRKRRLHLLRGAGI